MTPTDRMVVGRVVSLADGHVRIQTPPGPRQANWTRIETLIAAAREFKADQNPETETTLRQAALRID